MDELAINWKNFAQVGLHLKFAFRIKPYISFITIMFKTF